MSDATRDDGTPPQPPVPRSRRRGPVFWIQLAVTALLVAWLVRVALKADVLPTLASADPWWLLLSMVVVNLDRLLMAFKWHLLLRAKQVPVSLSAAVGTYYKATFWSGFLLPSVGGDALRVYETSRASGRFEDVTSSVVLERGLGMIATATVGVLGIGLFIVYVDSAYLTTLWAFVAILAAMLVVFALSMNRRWAELLATRLEGSPRGVVARLAAILRSYQGYARHRRVVAWFLCLSILEQLAPVVQYWTVVRALHLEITPLQLIMFVPITTAIERLPISYNGFGVREGLFIYLFGLVGTPQGDALLLGLISRIVGKFAYAVPFAVWYALGDRAKMRA